ncbi:hypothetical protein OEZ85_006844 [Tetradesmus obliquus]|uniref:Coiled-coil domain-containing protein n=1 Tax=Tetradesmus obliquus TaxID=3088 RepID=A0ABY8TVV3_TETOB|nr:hypothetical protein OEZ85_006844 [Tetradesmus obliquus]
MAPKKNMNEKVEAARERKAAAKDAASKKASKDAEDAYWREAGEGAKTKAQAKRDDEERKRQEAAARKAELKRLQEQEEAALAKPKTTPKANRVSGPKVTHHELDKLRESEAAAKEAEQKERAMAAKREVSSQSYSRMLEVENTNRLEDAVDARSMEQAIDALSSLGVVETPPADKHPEKRMRAAWKAFEEHNLPLLRMEKPNLKQAQYKDMLWKMWQKSPDNPAFAAGKQ